MARTALVLLTAFVVSTVGAGAPLKPAGAPAPEVTAPLAYRDLMLVLVTRDGVAAVTFANPAADGSEVEYTFRYESADGTKKLADTARLYERRVPPQGGFDPNGLSIAAGPVSIKWSKSNAERGWIYYLPETVTVHLANARDFEDLDLRRFTKK